MGVLNGDQVENIESYIYTITEATTTGINVYVKTTVNPAYVWGWSGTTSVTGNNWPGLAINSLDKVTINDIEWYCLHVDADEVNVIFNNGEYGFENQTTAIPVTRDAFFIYNNSDLSTYGYSAADTYIDVTEKYAGAGSASYEKVYVLGNINTTGWAPNNGFEMTTTNGEKYTATIDFVDPYGGYSYFSFSTALASSATDWDAIANDRMGATTNNFLINEARLGTELSVVAGTNAFRIATGKYNLTLYLTGGKLIVEKWTEEQPAKPGDVDMDGAVSGAVSVSDVVALIDYILTGDATGINLENADVDNNNGVSVGDVTHIIDMLLTSEM